MNCKFCSNELEKINESIKYETMHCSKCRSVFWYVDKILNASIIYVDEYKLYIEYSDNITILYVNSDPVKEFPFALEVDLLTIKAKIEKLKCFV